MDKELWKATVDKVLDYPEVPQKALCALIDLAIQDYVFVDTASFSS